MGAYDSWETEDLNSPKWDREWQRLRSMPLWELRRLAQQAGADAEAAMEQHSAANKWFLEVVHRAYPPNPLMIPERRALESAEKTWRTRYTVRDRMEQLIKLREQQGER